MKRFASGFIIGSTLVTVAQGHGYLSSPRSRNYDAAINGAFSKAGVPPIDYCPHCLNQAKGAKICGFNTYNDYDNFRDSRGNPMPWISVANYTAGQVIDVKSYLDTHHNGHMEISACPDGDLSTLQCFEVPANKLTFVEDVMWGMPADPSYPERGMYYGGQGGSIKSFHMRFKLPNHVAGDKVLLQWRYITANSCSPPGYASYFTTNNLPSSFWTSGVRACSPPYPSDGTRSEVWPEQFFNCASVSIKSASPTISPAPTTPYVPPPTVMPANIPTPAPGTMPVQGPVQMPTWGGPGGPGCCSLDFKTCVTWCGADQNGCETCGNNEVVWLVDGAPNNSCMAKYADCTSNSNGCCPGLTCVKDSQYYSQCRRLGSVSPSPMSPSVTGAPTIQPTSKAPVPTSKPTSKAPVPPSTMAPTAPRVNGTLFSTTESLYAWDAFLLLQSLTYKVTENPPLYALQASGGAAGSGNVVSESQAYAVLITSIVLASWDTHKKASLSNADWDDAVKHFQGYFNGWKSMCLKSNKFSGCQSDGIWCKDVTTGQSGVCLPGWKHNGDLSGEIGTGSAPDGDEDAIVGMIIALKVFDKKVKPSWYNELRKWADASCTAFLYYNTVLDSTQTYRILKLGSCWGGWQSNGNNPSYHSPGSFKVMRDFHVAFPQGDRDYSLPNFGGSGTLKDKWNQLIDTSYAFLATAQCPDQGMVPNWAMASVRNGVVEHFPGSFSGSGTPQWEYGAEAARTTWRVAMDAALYPNNLQDDAKPYLNPLLQRLRSGFNPSLSFNEKYFSADTFTTCSLPGTSNTIYKFSGGWVWNAFIFAPTVSALIVPISNVAESEQQSMVNAVGRVLASNIPTDYYARCWTILAILTLNGAIQSAGNVLSSPSILTSGIPCCSNNLKDCITWECNGCNESEQKCLSSQSGFYWMPWGQVLDPNSCIAITYSCDGHQKNCCPGMVCDPSYARPGPCIVAPSSPSVGPFSAAPTAAPLTLPPTKAPSTAKPTSVTSTPTTRAPTNAPSTAKPTSVTSTPTTRAPTKAPSTAKPTSVTSTPTTRAPTKAPSTAKPTSVSSKPTTRSPTKAPSTTKPTSVTSTPTTRAPTKASTTAKPTKTPSTAKPTSVTATPTTRAPTKAPSTAKPSTISPTNAPLTPTPAPVGTSNGIPLPCCSWNGSFCEQPSNTWCHAVQSQCTGACSGQWITGATSPTPAPASSPNSGAGCCTWGGWSTCPEWTQNSQDPCQLTAAGCTICSGTWIPL